MMRQRLRSFVRNQSGLSAVEFALIAPVMLLVLLGMVDIANVLSANRKLNAATSAIADIGAQAQALDDSDLQDLYAAAEVLLEPFDPQTISIVVSSVVADSDGRLSVDWSDATRTSPRNGLGDNPIPEGAIPPGGSVLMAELSLTHDGGFGNSFPSG